MRWTCRAHGGRLPRDPSRLLPLLWPKAPSHPPVRHRVRLLGTEHALVILLMHGFGTDQQSWAGLLPLLMPTHRVVLVVQAGAGGFDASANDRER